MPMAAEGCTPAPRSAGRDALADSTPNVPTIHAQLLGVSDAHVDGADPLHGTNTSHLKSIGEYVAACRITGKLLNQHELEITITQGPGL